MLQDTENPWKIFASQINAQYSISEEGTSQVIGEYRDYKFQLKIVFIQAAPKVNLFLTHFDLFLHEPTELKLKIYREGIIQKLTKLFGTKDIIFGDRTFDKRYIIEGSHEDKIKTLITPKIRATIIELGEIMIILDGKKFSYEQSGKIIDIQKLYKVLDLLVELANGVQQ
ncbi:hypothetical protein B6D60_08285 [candidate division KSB1 bacterium 4484_87]|nr:MAG: hypothetical protein B6D60_08285 [candidate division KSB1 bacterium 4484_87]